MKFTSRMKKQT